MIVKSQLTLGPLEEILTQVEETGTLPVDERGEPIYIDGNGHQYPMWQAIDGLVDMFEMWATRHHKPLPLAPLRMLVGALHYSMPITAFNLEEVKQALPRLREAALSMDHHDARDLVVQTQIKAELDAKESQK